LELEALPLLPLFPVPVASLPPLLETAWGALLTKSRMNTMVVILPERISSSRAASAYMKFG
jgi:hypothetical protein